MNPMRHFFARLLVKDDGVTVVEYAIMLAMIVLVAIGAIINAGNASKTFWLDTADQIDTVAPTGAEL